MSRYVKSSPHFFRPVGRSMLLGMAVLAVLAALVPAPLEPPADGAQRLPARDPVPRPHPGLEPCRECVLHVRRPRQDDDPVRGRVDVRRVVHDLDPEDDLGIRGARRARVQGPAR